MDDLNLDHNKYKPMFVNWAVRATKQISSPAQRKRKIKVIDVDDNRVAILPCEAEVLELALLGDYGECWDLFNQMGTSGLLSSVVTSDDTFLIVDNPGTTNFIGGFVPHTVQDGKIYFTAAISADKVTVQYQGVEVDKDGLPKVLDLQLEAIIEYCSWKFKSSRMKNYFEKAVADGHERRWHELAARARGDAATLTEAEQQQIASLINNPLAGRSLYLTNIEY